MCVRARVYAWTGLCQRCQHGAYLLQSRCEQDAGACAAAGLVAVGTGGSKYGRACIKAGEICRLNSRHSCRSPKMLGDCTASVVTVANVTCIECDIGSWLLNGQSLMPDLQIHRDTLRGIFLASFRLLAWRILILSVCASATFCVVWCARVCMVCRCVQKTIVLRAEQ